MALKTKSFGELITFTRSTGGGRFNASGQYEWLPANEPRIDYDPVSGECRGILIEEQRTNLLLRSAEFDIASWPLAAASVVGNSTTGPDGTLTADKLVPNTVNTNHFISQSTALADGTVATFSFFAKAAEYSQVRVNLRDKAGVFRSSIVSLVDGAVVVAPPSGLTVSVSGVGNGWFRVSCTLNFGSGATTPAVYIYPAVNGTDFFAGDGTSGIYIWGAQLEAGAFPTSYIPTTTAQVTRAADVCSVDNLSPWFRADEGTLMVEASSSAISSALTLAGFTQVPAIGETRMRLIRWTDGTTVRFNLENQGNPPSTQSALSDNPRDGAPYRYAAYYSNSAFAVSARGALNQRVTLVGVPAATTLDIGTSRSSGGSRGFFLNGHIRRIRYIPRRISDTELQALTAI